MNMTIQNLLAQYRERTLTPDELIESLLEQCRNDESNIWIRLLTHKELEPYLRNLDGLDFLVTPTAGTCYTIDEVNADPIALNSNLGYYTNYMNLLDYCSLAVPAAMTSPIPFGVTLVGRAFGDALLLAAGASLHAKTALPVGCTKDFPPAFSIAPKNEKILVAVCGAHLEGLPLHHR